MDAEYEKKLTLSAFYTDLLCLSIHKFQNLFPAL